MEAADCTRISSAVNVYSPEADDSTRGRMIEREGIATEEAETWKLTSSSAEDGRLKESDPKYVSHIMGQAKA